MSNSDFIKPMAMVACVVAGDKYILGETDMNSSLYLGVSGAAGVYAAKLVAPLIPFESMLPDGSFTDARTLELRLLEVGGAVGVGFVLNKYILKNDPYVNVQMNKLALLAGADFAAEYIDDYISGRPLSFFR
jgi:hypothetical protein